MSILLSEYPCRCFGCAGPIVFQDCLPEPYQQIAKALSTIKRFQPSHNALPTMIKNPKTRCLRASISTS